MVTVSLSDCECVEDLISVIILFCRLRTFLLPDMSNYSAQRMTNYATLTLIRMNQ